MVKRICVFCGSSPGSKPGYTQAARQLGRALAEQELGLVYGGGKIGLMGTLAEAVLEQGGDVIGVIPEALMAQELGNRELADLRVVATMHDRKALMGELADGFITLPGGLGTFEEFFETLTWAQLGIHPKPCGLLNVNHYYDDLIRFLDHVAAEQFMEQAHRSMVLIDDNPATLLAKLATYQPPQIDKVAWAKRMHGQ